MADPRPRPPVELLWPGKYAPDGRRAADLPRPDADLRLVARHGPPDDPAGLLVEGDSSAAAAALLPAHRAAADLVYLDPPFDTGDDFRLPDGSVAYADRWDGPGDYLSFLDRRLADAHALLADRGTLWLHLDHRRVHHARAQVQHRLVQRRQRRTARRIDRKRRPAKIERLAHVGRDHVELRACDRVGRHRRQPRVKRRLLLRRHLNRRA